MDARVRAIELTEEQRALVEAHIDAAGQVTRETRGVQLDAEERLSAAYYGMCEAAPRAINFEASRGYLCRAAKSRILLDARSRRRHGFRVSTVDDLGAFDRGANGWQSDVEAEDELRHWLSQIDRHCEPRDAEAIGYWLQGHSHSEIGRIMGISDGSARSAVYEGLKRLRAVIQG
jgi:DNA-directed RNA polymerase specialized sigma24 family protein